MSSYIHRFELGSFYSNFIFILTTKSDIMVKGTTNKRSTLTTKQLQKTPLIRFSM